MQENGNAVLVYRRHAAVDARHIAVLLLNVWQNRIMCPVRLQGIVAVKTHSVNWPLEVVIGVQQNR